MIEVKAVEVVYDNIMLSEPPLSAFGLLPGIRLFDVVVDLKVYQWIIYST